MYKKNNALPKTEITKQTAKSQKTETLSSLLKKFDQSIPKVKEVGDLASNFITKARLKEAWSETEIVLKSWPNKLPMTKNEIPKTSDLPPKKIWKTAEDMALCSADYLEKSLKELNECIKEINKTRDPAIEFARNCFIYLNKVHNGSCLGEAGKIMLDLFDKGDLSGNVILGLIDRAEEISEKKSLPFANKLTPSQTKAISFMVEERDQRINPTIESLQQYVILSNNVLKYTPLLQALTEEDTPKAQKLVDNLLNE